MNTDGVPAGDETTLTIRVASEVELAEFAVRLVKALPPSAFVALRGDLGAGKTTFVKHVAAARGLDPSTVVSPTFGLIHEYHLATQSGSGITDRIVHADMYRLTGVDDLAETGWHDAVAGECQVFVEWPERIRDALPANRIDVAIVIDSPTMRTLTLTGRGPTHARSVANLKAP